MMDRQAQTEALAILEAQLVRLRAIVVGYERRGEMVPAEAELAIEDIIQQIEDMTRDPVRH